NDILRRMNRHYTAEEFIDRVGELKRSINDLAVTTDVIVGFPGETDNDFEQTTRVIKAAGFSKLHVFKYSPRRGTPAAEYGEQVQSSVKDDRSARLIKIGDRLSESFAVKFIGRSVPVLIERDLGEYLTGISDNYLRVLCGNSPVLCDSLGEIVTVSILGYENGKLAGEALTGEASQSDENTV
ncbi:MAG: radical SAM protein, partial [Rubrobacteridae bacterium]|nr:radical SAM protein [Rubrobacteridae bacterium]